MISLDKLTIKSQEVLQEAIRMASERGHAQVEPDAKTGFRFLKEGGTLPA